MPCIRHVRLVGLFSAMSRSRCTSQHCWRKDIQIFPVTFGKEKKTDLTETQRTPNLSYLTSLCRTHAVVDGSAAFVGVIKLQLNSVVCIESLQMLSFIKAFLLSSPTVSPSSHACINTTSHVRVQTKTVDNGGSWAGWPPCYGRRGKSGESQSERAFR